MIYKTAFTRGILDGGGIYSSLYLGVLYQIFLSATSVQSEIMPRANSVSGNFKAALRKEQKRDGLYILFTPSSSPFVYL